jgi:hypothetical protein
MRKIITTYEILELLTGVKEEMKGREVPDDNSICEVAHLLTGTFVYPLYGALWQNFIDMDTVTEHYVKALLCLIVQFEP